MKYCFRTITECSRSNLRYIVLHAYILLICLGIINITLTVSTRELEPYYVKYCVTNPNPRLPILRYMNLSMFSYYMSVMKMLTHPIISAFEHRSFDEVKSLG
jgi:hypothetical protein